MRQRNLLNAVLAGSVLLLTACGTSTNSMVSNPMTGTAPVSLTMGDTPPTGVTVLSFEIRVTAASLQSSGGSVSLLSEGPVEVEVENLQVEKAFLGALSVAAGTYNDISVSFANPQMTIVNNSGAAIGSCANGATCELTPTLNPATVTFSGAPFPLTVSASQPLGLLMDFNLNQSIQTDLSVTPTLSFTQVAGHMGEDGVEIEPIDDIIGQITAVDSTHQTITVKDNASGQSFTATVNSNTEIAGFGEAGLANAFSSFQAGQVVELDLFLMSDGTFTAKKVELKVPEGQNASVIGGAVVAIDSPTEFKMVVREDSEQDGWMQVGSIFTVTIQSGATFQIDTDGATLPSTVTFASSADLLVGQNVQLPLPAGFTGTSLTASQVTLHRSQVTGSVASVNGATFTVNNLPGIFAGASPAIAQIDVQTSSQTQFENVSGVSALSAGDVVSSRGLLFKTAGNPLLVADEVVKRLDGDLMP